MTAPMDGLKPGRIVYLVLSAVMAAEIMRRRTTADSIVERIKQQVLTPDQIAGQLPKTVSQWPIGAQAHIGHDVFEGDIVPAMVVAVHAGVKLHINLKAMLDGSDTYWATNILFDESKGPGTWHWMFDGQQKRYDPTAAQK